MNHGVLAFALLLHVLFWGAGAALLAMPRPWRRFWPVLVAPAGLALQSAVVWAGAHAGFRGTLSYAAWSELLPAALLLLALRRRGARSAWNDWTRFGLVWAAVAGCLALLVLPVALASRSLTTISLGSCDAADYAAGARVLLEFSAADRGGFLGLTEVVRVASADNFFDYWLRLNHFTPSALIALNGAVLAAAPHELTTLMVAVLLAATLPLVFWSARAIFGYSGGVSLLIAGLYGIGPVPWYAFAHVSPGQLLAAGAIVLLTWPGVALWRGRLDARRGWSFAPTLAIGYWLILGSYNFMVLVCLVPAVAYAGGLALAARAGRRFLCWLGWMLGPLLLCGAGFAGRVVGLAERFTLLQTYDFGWRIPALSAEGWLGLVADPRLEAWNAFGLRWLLSAGVIGVFGWALLRGVQQRRRGAWTVLAVVVPVLAGYLFLQARGARLGTNASYDAYKLFAVFYPVLLPAFCWWVTLRWSRKLHEWLLVGGVAAVVGAGNAAACGRFVWELSRPPLIVDGELRRLRTIETMPDVASVNVLIPDMWSRLWANAFLLRKPQYFATHTYEARRDTPLRGEWDLTGGIVRVRLPDGGERAVAQRYFLLDTRAPAFVRARVPDEGGGWHPEESAGGGAERWRWTGGDATVLIENPHARPLAFAAELEGWSPVPRTVTLDGAAGGGSASARIGAARAVRALGTIAVPPGASTWTLRIAPAAAPAGGDPRALGVGVYRLTLTPGR
jgi:hypothetical protein